MASSAEQYARRQGLNIRDALVFLVDWRVSMIRKDPSIKIAEDICSTPNSSSLLSITLRCIADVMKTKIVARNKDTIAVIAFGARGSHTRQGWPGVRILRPLKQADAAGIKQMQTLARRLEEGDADHLLDLSPEELAGMSVDTADPDFSFGPSEPVEFDKALWAVRHHFTAMAAGKIGVMHRKRVFVFTNDQDPSGGNTAVRNLSLTQVKDLAELGATLDVSLLMSPGQFGDTVDDENVLDGSVFFNDLVYVDEDNSEEDRGVVMIATVYSFDDMLVRVRKKEMTKRAIKRTVLVLGNDYKIGIAIYALVVKAVRPTKVQLNASTNRPVFKITTTTCTSTGEVLRPNDVRHKFTPDFLKKPARRKKASDGDIHEGTGADNVEDEVFGFKPSELAQIKAVGQLGIVLYGFRKKEALRKEYTTQSPKFLYPDDTEYSGSTVAFAGLLKAMISRGVVGIASMRLSERVGGGMRFVALVPQLEVEGEDGDPGVPGGMHIHYLPFKDDIYTAWRAELKSEPVKYENEVLEEEDVNVEELNKEPESVSAARQMVRRMKISGNYSPQLFLNPDLQRFYAGLENAAGVESRYNPQDELLNPNVEEMQKRGGRYAHEMVQLAVGIDFDGESIAEQYGTKTKKRSLAEGQSASNRQTQKRLAQQQAANECDDEDFQRRWRDGSLSKSTVADLRLYCRAHGLKATGRKGELLMVVMDHIEDRIVGSQV